MKALTVESFKPYAEQYQMKPLFPFTPGSECAGIITELADDVPHLKVGDRVAAMVQNGGFASEVLAPMMVTWPIGAHAQLVWPLSRHRLRRRRHPKNPAKPCPPKIHRHTRRLLGHMDHERPQRPPSQYGRNFRHV